MFQCEFGLNIQQYIDIGQTGISIKYADFLALLGQSNSQIGADITLAYAALATADGDAACFLPAVCLCVDIAAPLILKACRCYWVRLSGELSPIR